MDATDSKLAPNTKRRLLLILGWVWVAGLLVVILATFFPVLGRRQQRSHGEICGANLDRIFRAKEALAERLRMDASESQRLQVDSVTLGDLFPKDPPECPAGGKYKIGPLVDANGEVVPPICTSEEDDPDGNGIDNKGESLHIHCRSYLQDPGSGVYFREPAFVFPE